MSGEACSHSFCIAIFLQMEIRHLLQSQANTLLDAVRSDCWQINEFNWDNQLHYFKQWLMFLRREVESPNLWSAITQESEIINATTADESNTLFSASEKSYVLFAINEIKQYLLTAHRIDPELVESRLNYLVGASNRVGRKDWINLLLSVLIGIVVAAAIPPETTREIFRFVGNVLSQILHQPLLLT